MVDGTTVCYDMSVELSSVPFSTANTHTHMYTNSAFHCF